MKLIPIDLAKGENQTHSDIRTDGTTYLCKIRGLWFAGTFENEWYGLNFIGWINPVGLQYDKPRTNASRWESVFELVEEGA